MALGAGYWTCYVGAQTGGASGARAQLRAAWEGITPTEWGFAQSEALVAASGGYIDIVLPLPPNQTLAEGTYEAKFRAKKEGAYDGTIRAQLIADATTISGEDETISNSEYADETSTLSIIGDIEEISSLKLRLYNPGLYSVYVLACYPTGNTPYVGCKDGGAETPRTTPVLLFNSPAVGSHEQPTPITGTPTFTGTAKYLYTDDVAHILKWTDTLRTAAHSPSAESDQTVGALSTITSALASDGTRTIAATADATRKPDALTNTFYQFQVLDSGDGEQAVVDFETRLTVERPTLSTLNGSSGSPIISRQPAPLVIWTNPNPDADRYQVRVYNTDDELQHDSTETVGTVTNYALPNTLTANTTMYVVVTVMRGASGATWTVDSERGYFEYIDTKTALKFTSHTGTRDTPEVIATQAPALTWSFAPTQAAYCVSVFDESDQSLDHFSDWVRSATEAYTLPGATLTWGKTYSIQLQVQDEQSYVYQTDERVYLHTNSATVLAPTLTPEPDTDTETNVTLEWTAPADGDSDTYTYEVEVTGPDGVPVLYSVGDVELFMGRLSA